MQVDLRLNAIVDPERAGGHDLAELARLCAQGGATLVQLRDKLSGNRRHGRYRPARSKKRWRRFRCRLSSTTGSMLRSPQAPTAVHVGQDDMAVADARRLLGRNAIIGLVDQDGRGSRRGASRSDRFTSARAAFTSRDRSSKRARRSARKGWRESSARCTAVHRRCRCAALPASMPATPARSSPPAPTGVAVISALSLAPDPAGAARTLREIVDGMLAKRSK